MLSWILNIKRKMVAGFGNVECMIKRKAASYMKIGLGCVSFIQKVRQAVIKIVAIKVERKQPPECTLPGGQVFMAEESTKDRHAHKRL
jgi:hypothetical protein